jgi:hypothetical protein
MRYAVAILLAAVLLVGDTPASARIVAAWECPGNNRSLPITVELHKYATAAYELRLSGILYVWGTGHGYNFKYVGQNGAKLNGKPCKILPYDPKWEADD